MKRLLSILLMLLSFSLTYAQENERVPKVKTFETGYRYMYTSTYSGLPKNAMAIAFDYAWQLSGFGGKAASFISVPFGYTYFIPASGESNASLIYYGWTVKHNLTKDKKFVPFLGYMLLLNQLKFKGVEGRDIGHETRFEFGYDIHLKGKMSLLVKLEYGMTFIPGFNKEKSDGFKNIGLKTGIRF